MNSSEEQQEDALPIFGELKTTSRDRVRMMKHFPKYLRSCDGLTDHEYCIKVIIKFIVTYKCEDEVWCGKGSWLDMSSG